MPFSVRTRVQEGVQKLDPTIVVLEDGAGGVAEIWPALGFNCFRWSAVHGGRSLELLFADPALFSDGRPTRSGIPILFPFPNRVADAQYVWNGVRYQMARTDSEHVNAIHGFVCRRAWRVVAEGSDAGGAFVTGAFRGSADAPDCVNEWPADYELRVTYRLTPGVLRLEAEVRNPDSKPLPWGLGYHPYFKVPFAPDVRPEDCLLTAPASSYWELSKSLPTGKVLPVDAARNLNEPRPFPGVTVDDVLTGLPPAGPDGYRLSGSIQGAPGVTLRVESPEDFRDTVVFTPPHRQAFCIEPYTCTTDAINLEARGIPAGWKSLPPGGSWSGAVVMRLA